MPDHTHIRRIRQEMPAATANLYFNAGTFGPIPTCVVKAAQERLQAEYLYGRLGETAWASMTTIYESARASAARLLNAN